MTQPKKAKTTKKVNAPKETKAVKATKEIKVPKENKKTIKAALMNELKEILKENKDFDYKKEEIKDSGVLKKLKWKKKDVSEEDTVQVLRAYQRVARIMPKDKDDVAIKLLDKGIHSALQIAAMPKHKFIKENKDVFTTVEEEKVAEEIHQKAQIRRSQLVTHYMNWKQNNEPHAKAARV